MGFPDLPAAPAPGKRTNLWEEQAVDYQEQWCQQLAAMDMEQALQRMTGRPDMTFRGVQVPAIQAIQDGASPNLLGVKI